jgi:hypothetical protein
MYVTAYLFLFIPLLQLRKLNLMLPVFLEVLAFTPWPLPYEESLHGYGDKKITPAASNYIPVMKFMAIHFTD